MHLGKREKTTILKPWFNMTLKYEQMPRQLEILVRTDEDRLGENPFVTSKVIVNSLTDKTDQDTQKENTRTLEQS